MWETILLFVWVFEIFEFFEFRKEEGGEEEEN